MFLTFEGIDGSGKTTLSSAVAQRLRERGNHVVLFHKKSVPPGVDPYVERHLKTLGRLLWDDADRQPIHLLGNDHWVRIMAAYFAATTETVIRPALSDGAIVVTDNWYYKFIARMTINTAHPRHDFDDVFGALDRPSRTFFLDVDPEAAAVRKGHFTQGEVGKHQRDGADTADGFVHYQTKVAAFYRDLASEQGWDVISPGLRTPAELAEVVVDSLDRVR
ncbi:hypothetical protein DMB66_23215 [Actinoplanes sp. ATCC 53533]|uniref:dTMP kinase n=1 Tax=Actinoplanes sp. ATCC 53533 TaxID=1288362 RepID=UPI000F779AF2|nr:dTMP kinase [Actinoplanes sp. ATCC 53533]RSM61976.1 hypothetical protein DMB66_23215 [Actinoplanes sp. ATCC 53533]